MTPEEDHMAATLAVRHSFEDFDAWKIAFDEHRAVREAFGCTGEAVLSLEGEPNTVLVLTSWPSLEAAHSFAEDPALPDAMKRGKVLGAPQIEFYEGAVS
jgi:heme-degrading monooxygenase HmoA